MELDLSLLIQFIAYAFLFGCSLKYLTAMSSKRVSVKQSSNVNKQQLEELQKIKKDLHYYDQKFQCQYVDALKGKYKKAA